MCLVRVEVTSSLDLKKSPHVEAFGGGGFLHREGRGSEGCFDNESLQEETGCKRCVDMKFFVSLK